jgi:hypothetical protein
MGLIGLGWVGFGFDWQSLFGRGVDFILFGSACLLGLVSVSQRESMCVWVCMCVLGWVDGQDGTGWAN